jgi:hypothetical protein
MISPVAAEKPLLRQYANTIAHWRAPAREGASGGDA